MESLNKIVSAGDSRAVSVADRIGDQLRDEIIGGRLAPGTQLVEVELSAKYLASRNTIREVLHKMGREGLATFIRHKGVVVRAVQSKDLKDIYVARRALELYAIAEAPELQPSALEHMLDTIRAAERALALERWQEVGTLSLQMHQQIVAMLGSRLIDDFFRTLCAQLRLVFASHPDESQIQTVDWIERELRIHTYLTDNDRRGALRELKAYLALSEQILLEVVEQFGQPTTRSRSPRGRKSRA